MSCTEKIFKTRLIWDEILATYIPDLEQEEESLITAKIESEIEKLKKRMDEYMFVYVNDEKNINYKVQIESSMKS